MLHGHFVYKYVLNEEIIYIGKNDTDLHSRIAQHGKKGDNIPQYAWKDINAADVYYIELTNRVMSDVVEKELIRRYKPKYNKEGVASEWSGLPFAEPEWKSYVPKTKKPQRSNASTFKNKVEKAVKENSLAKRSLQNLLDALDDEENIFPASVLTYNEDDIKSIIFVDRLVGNINRRLVKDDLVSIITPTTSFDWALSVSGILQIQTENGRVRSALRSRLPVSDLRNEVKHAICMINQYEEYAKNNLFANDNSDEVKFACNICNADCPTFWRMKK